MHVGFIDLVSPQVPPLLVIELLHRIMDIIKDYFGAVNESVIKDQFVIVYEVCLSESSTFGEKQLQMF